MKSVLLFGLCITLSLLLVFGSVNSPYSFTLPNTAFASDEGHTPEDSGGGDNTNHGDDNQGGDTGDQDNDHGDSSHGMPPPEDAPATTGTITAGGGGSDDVDEADNDNSDNDNDNDNDNPQIPKDTPATSDALTAKKLECLPSQEVTLFSTTCEPAGGGAGNTQSTTSAATLCPTSPSSPTPTSYNMLDESSVAYAVWGYSEAETDQHEMQKSLLHAVQSSPTESKPADTTNCPPLGLLPFRGDEPRLIDFYAMPVPDPDSVSRFAKTGAGSTFTFEDHTIRTSSQEPDPLSPGYTIDKTIITPGPGTPLDGLQVDRVEQTSYIDKNGDRSPDSTDTTIKYKDGKKTDYRGDLQEIKVDDGKGNIQSISVISGTTYVNKPDGSYTVYPKPGTGNSYTVYPRAADGTQKTVTVTSEGQPIVTVRDANNNIIPPKE